jgi:tetratricopeptide (TPR) repeat protein
MCDRAMQLQIVQALLEGHIKAGAAYSAAGNTEKALREYQQIDQILSPLNDGSYKTNSLYATMPEKMIKAGIFNFRKAVNHGLIGDIYHKTGKENFAAENYKAAIELIKPLLADRILNDTLDYMRAMWLLGNNYSKIGDHTQAIKYFENAELLFTKEKNIDEKVSFLKALYEAYGRKGDDKKAYASYRKYISLKDSIQALQNAGEVSQLQKRFEVEKKDADIDLLSKAQEAQEAELEKQKLVRNGFIIGSVIFLILAIIIFRSLQQNRKAKKIIEEQKEEVEHKNKEITDSIRYAQRIQSAMMPQKEHFEKTLKRLTKKK